MSETMAVQETIYDANMQMTGMVDFGLDVQTVMAHKAPIPPQGLRVNVAFQGEVKGQKLSGRITGTDYVLFRPDGVVVVDVHGTIDTQDGERVAVRADGILVAQPDSPVGQLRENVSLYSASPRYAWVNRLQGWGTGTSDLSTGKIVMRLFAA